MAFAIDVLKVIGLSLFGLGVMGSVFWTVAFVREMQWPTL